MAATTYKCNCHIGDAHRICESAETGQSQPQTFDSIYIKQGFQIAQKFYVPKYWPNFFLTHQTSTKLNKLLTTT
jgi:hypothetical protein